MGLNRTGLMSSREIPKCLPLFLYYIKMQKDSRFTEARQQVLSKNRVICNSDFELPSLQKHKKKASILCDSYGNLRWQKQWYLDGITEQKGEFGANWENLNKYRLWLILIYQYWLVNCSKYTILRNTLIIKNMERGILWECIICSLFVDTSSVLRITYLTLKLVKV